MIQLIIDNSICKICDLPRDRHKELRKILSYRDTSKRIQKIVKDKKTGRAVIDPRTRKPKMTVINPLKFLLDKYGVFPTGLLYLVEEYLKKTGIKHVTIDVRERPEITRTESIIVNKKLVPYPEQKEAATIGAKSERGIIVAPTGVGKSVIIALLIDELQLKTLVVVPGVELKYQLIDSLRDMLGPKNVGPLVSGKAKYLVTVENKDRLDPKKRIPGLHKVIIDEFHRSGANGYRVLNDKMWDEVYFKFGMTATPFRSRDTERLLLESVLSKVIYKIDYVTAVEKGYIVPMESYYIELPEVKCKAKTYAEAYQELIVTRKDRNEIIVDMAMNLFDDKKSTLILVKIIEHGRILKRMLEDLGYDVPFANGTDGNNGNLIKDFNSQKFHVMIGTEGVLGEGIDTKPCEYVVMAGGGKSKNAFMQKVGRAFRKFLGKESCKVILFKDKSNKWLLEHFNACKRYLKEEYGLLIEKL